MSQETAATDGGSSTSPRSSTGDLRAAIGRGRILLYALLAVIAVYFLIPIEAGLVTSFKTDEAVVGTAPYLPPGPGGFTLENWMAAFDTLSSGLVNSLVMTIPATVLGALFGSLAAYGLTQISWKGQVPIFALFVAGVFIPYQAVLVPLSQFWSMIPLEEMLSPLWALPLFEPYHADLIELIVTHTAYGIPISTVLFRGYYMGLSEEMVEAARLDGAGVFEIYRRIILPLSGPMFAVVLIYQFTQIWNELLFALILVGGTGPSAPVTLSLVGLGASLEGVDFGLRMAGAFLTALPTLLVFIIFGDQFARGVAGRT
ncbi:carbohydrate ABC transporter permease [Halococcus sediminicola]|uniref:carbohydrate ABC transporter permease n=1 Tax=Halococcus sediminicola TaxID=1264579 RepID=UPI000678F96A|nr:carbohydrate ABC transporter permease [Halococcus sediminicola]